MKRILVIDDEQDMLESLQKILSFRDEFECTFLNDSYKAKSLLSEDRFDLVITDLNMPNVSGIEIVQSALENNPNTKVIIVSGYGSIESSVNAIKVGAFDFIEKPFTSSKLFECIDRAISSSDDSTSIEGEDFEGIIYKSSVMKNFLQELKKVSNYDMNILITGESGVGKELIARAIHKLSKNTNDPFVPVNCGALPEHLFESELFGHEKGAFTGAIKTKPGLLEFANNGTFFFDEIGDMPFDLQVKLLRMLEEKKIRRVGGQREIDINVRIIAATNQDLEKNVNEKRFRQDLYYRLNNITLDVPPLRSRTEDIIPLVDYFIKELSIKNSIQIHSISNEAKDALINYSWPGNVRELKNIIARSYFLCSDNIIQLSDLPSMIVQKSNTIDKNILNLSYKDAKESILEKFEIDYLSHYLKLNDGNISKAAEACGLDRRSIHRLINKYNIVYQNNNEN